MNDKELRSQVTVLARVARIHFLKGHTNEEAEDEIYDRLVEIIKKVEQEAYNKLVGAINKAREDVYKNLEINKHEAEEDAIFPLNYADCPCCGKRTYVVDPRKYGDIVECIYCSYEIELTPEVAKK